MYRYVKCAIEDEDIAEAGLDELWDDDVQNKDDIVQEVESMSSREIVEYLEEELDEDSFKRVMVSLAAKSMER